jgi:repressor LexA
MSRLITLRQTEILNFIKRFLLEAGYAPTRRDIMHHFGLKSTRGVEDHLTALKKSGHLTQGVKGGKGARTLLVRDLSVVISFPVVRKVISLRPISAEENVDGTLALDSRAAPWKDAFFIQINDEALEKTGILKGDYVLVIPQPSAKEGELVAAALGGQVLVRYFARKDDSIFLYKEKTDSAPIEAARGVMDFRFLGKAVSVHRFMDGPMALSLHGFNK